MATALRRAGTARRPVAPRQELSAGRQSASSRPRTGRNVAAAGGQEQFRLLSDRAPRCGRTNDSGTDRQGQGAGCSMEAKDRDGLYGQDNSTGTEELIAPGNRELEHSSV